MQRFGHNIEGDEDGREERRMTRRRRGQSSEDMASMTATLQEHRKVMLAETELHVKNETFYLFFSFTIQTFTFEFRI